jgi:hypothetical protein
MERKRNNSVNRVPTFATQLSATLQGQRTHFGRTNFVKVGKQFWEKNNLLISVKNYSSYFIIENYGKLLFKC